MVITELLLPYSKYRQPFGTYPIPTDSVPLYTMIKRRFTQKNFWVQIVNMHNLVLVLLGICRVSNLMKFLWGWHASTESTNHCYIPLVHSWKLCIADSKKLYCLLINNQFTNKSILVYTQWCSAQCVRSIHATAGTHYHLGGVYSMQHMYTVCVYSIWYTICSIQHIVYVMRMQYAFTVFIYGMQVSPTKCGWVGRSAFVVYIHVLTVCLLTYRRHCKLGAEEVLNGHTFQTYQWWKNNPLS